MNYEQDTNGNRITLGYNGQNQLVTLTYSNPSDPSEPTEQLTSDLQRPGFRVPGGRRHRRHLDLHLRRGRPSAVGDRSRPTAAGLTTSYTYDTGSNPETANALLSITSPNGSQENFTYSSATGRLTGTSHQRRRGRRSPTPTRARPRSGHRHRRRPDHRLVQRLGLPARVQDPLGGISTYLYDNNGNLVSYTDAAGDTYQYTYDPNGNLTQTVNPLGQTVQMTYNSLSDLTSITDADGNTTQYSYSSAGNLLSITYPDGTQQSFTYDPLGNLSETIEQNGDPVSYQYNAQGLVTQETFADGTSETFTYDAHGNMLTAETYRSGGN